MYLETDYEFLAETATFSATFIGHCLKHGMEPTICPRALKKFAHLFRGYLRLQTLSHKSTIPSIYFVPFHVSDYAIYHVCTLSSYVNPSETYGIQWWGYRLHPGPYCNCTSSFNSKGIEYSVLQDSKAIFITSDI